MSFLAPLFFLGALALAAPVIFHLIRRTTRERMRFSSLMFLRPSPPRLTKRSRLENLLLLFLRCLALALVAFAFTRPFVKEAVVSEVSPTAVRQVVVLVDASASMRRDGAWAGAVARATQVLEATSAADRVALLTYGREVTTLVGFEDWTAALPDQRVALATGRLADTGPGWGGSQLGGALSLAVELLADAAEVQPDSRREVVVIGDLQAGSRLEALQTLEWPRGVEVVLEPVSVRTGTNASLQLMADAADVERAGEPRVRVRVSNAPGGAREQFQVGWRRRDGTAVGEPIGTYVPPGQSRVVVLPVPSGGELPTEIALTGDDEAFDNRVFVIPPQPQALSVAYLGSEAANDTQGARFFLERALRAAPGVSVQVNARPAAQPWSPEEQAAASLVVVNEPLPAARADEVRAGVMAGRTALVTVSGTAMAGTLARLVGVPAVPMDEVASARYAMLAEIDFRHPLFLPFADPRFSDFTKIHFWRHRKLDLAGWPAPRVLASFDSGDPALIELSLGRGRLLVLTTTWAPADSQLAVSSKFVPWLYSLLELTGGLTTPVSAYVVGDEPAIPVQAGPVTVQDPDGRVVATLAAGESRLPALNAPGVYTVVAGTAPVTRVAVNLDAAESRLTPLTTEDFERLGAPLARTAVDPVQAEQREVVLRGVETEGRQKLWRWFIVATLLILLVESILAGRTARRAGALETAATT